jgi:hypothetical protein
MPNPEKEKRKELLHQRIAEAQLGRATAAVKELVEEKGKKSAGTGGHKKVIQKPPRKLGGGGGGRGGGGSG